MLVIVADDHNVAADMFWLTGIDAGTCSDVFLPQCRCTEHTGHGELIEGDAGKEIACPTHPNACSVQCICRAEPPELPCSLQVDFRPLPDQLCTSLRMGSWTPPRHNIINKAWILRLVDHLNSQTRWCRSIQMYHTRVDKFRASYVALVINIKTSLFTPSTFFDANFEQRYHSNMLRLRLECV